MTVRSLVAVAFGISIAVSSAPALAKTLDSYATGAHGWSYGTNRSVAIMDTKADNNEVYVNYQRTGEGVLRITNHNGNGSTADSVNRTPVIFRIMACTELDFQRDTCDSWRS